MGTGDTAIAMLIFDFLFPFFVGLYIDEFIWVFNQLDSFLVVFWHVLGSNLYELLTDQYQASALHVLAMRVW